MKTIKLKELRPLIKLLQDLKAKDFHGSSNINWYDGKPVSVNLKQNIELDKENCDNVVLESKTTK